MSNDFCVAYSVNRRRFIKEVLLSSRTTKTFLPHWADLVLHKDDGDYSYDFSLFNKVFTNPDCEEYKRHSFKLVGLLHILCNTDYKYVLYLDSEAVVVKAGVFDFPVKQLETHDICAMQALKPYGPSSRELDVMHQTLIVPNTIPEVNGGVLFLKNNERTRNLLKNWIDVYNSYEDFHDQGALRYVLYRMGFKVFYLPETYNFRKPDINKLTTNPEDLYIWHQRRALGKITRHDPTKPIYKRIH